METVEVVIKMPKSEYEELTRGRYTWWGRHGEYIKKGTLLPKGHGRLVDADAVMEYYTNNINCIKEKMYAIEMLEQALESRTVIEANKDGE